MSGYPEYRLAGLASRRCDSLYRVAAPFRRALYERRQSVAPYWNVRQKNASSPGLQRHERDQRFLMSAGLPEEQRTLLSRRTPAGLRWRPALQRRSSTIVNLL